MLIADAPPPPAVIRSALAQAVCAGETISRIDVRRHVPSPRNAAERALEATTEAVGLETVRRETEVIRAYVRLEAGKPCIERDRRESERMLRLQPFIASAAVTALPDGPGRVRIRVDVVDELPWVLGGGIENGGIDRVRVGTLDHDGRGLAIVASAERGGVYRPGIGLSLAQFGMFGRPAVASLQLDHRPLGGLLLASYAEPFLSDGQRFALHAGLTQETRYTTLLRPVGDPGAVRTQRSAYHLGWVKRVGTYRRDRVVGLAGVMFLGSDVRTTNEVVIVSDSGLVSTGDPVLSGRYADYGVSRLAVVGGLRALRFQTVERFDALRGTQDAPTGVQLNVLVAPGLWRASTARDLLIAYDLYAGIGSASSFAAVSMRAEARPALGRDGDWDGVVASSRFSWHRITSPRRTRVMSLSAASLHDLVFPAQLTLRDPDGGLVGFPGSRGAGGQRVVVRVEERMLMPWFARRADFALAAFVDAGRLWAGDVPYGAPTPVRSSVGFSLLGSYPSGGKRVYRVDVGIPVNAERGASGLALRFSFADRTGVSWLEPRDVSHARSGTGRASLMRW